MLSGIDSNLLRIISSDSHLVWSDPRVILFDSYGLQVLIPKNPNQFSNDFNRLQLIRSDSNPFPALFLNRFRSILDNERFQFGVQMLFSSLRNAFPSVIKAPPP